MNLTLTLDKHSPQNERSLLLSDAVLADESVLALNLKHVTFQEASARKLES